MLNTEILPLEAATEKLIRENKSELPDSKVDYWARYTHLLAALREKIYPYINAGLACLSKSPGIYTDHGPAHFDEVVKYAEKLITLPDGSYGLKPYELYLLLCAIRLHDAGNIEGREDHEKRVSGVLQACGGIICGDRVETEMISSIAEAHGGLSIKGDKDTISTLSPDGILMGATTCRPRQVAAILRFADEICEHRGRASHYLSTEGSLPEQNKLFHYYSLSIAGAAPNRQSKSFGLRFSIDAEYLLKKYLALPNKNGQIQKKYFINEVLDRVSKLDQERIYCNRFLDPALQTDSLEIDIAIRGRISKGSPSQGEVFRQCIIIPKKTGYPEPQLDWKKDLKASLNGPQMAKQAREEWK